MDETEISENFDNSQWNLGNLLDSHHELNFIAFSLNGLNECGIRIMHGITKIKPFINCGGDSISDVAFSQTIRHDKVIVEEENVFYKNIKSCKLAFIDSNFNTYILTLSTVTSIFSAGLNLTDKDQNKHKCLSLYQLIPPNSVVNESKIFNSLHKEKDTFTITKPPARIIWKDLKLEKNLRTFVQLLIIIMNHELYILETSSCNLNAQAIIEHDDSDESFPLVNIADLTSAGISDQSGRSINLFYKLTTFTSPDLTSNHCELKRASETRAFTDADINADGSHLITADTCGTLAIYKIDWVTKDVKIQFRFEPHGFGVPLTGAKLLEFPESLINAKEYRDSTADLLYIKDPKNEYMFKTVKADDYLTQNNFSDTREDDIDKNKKIQKNKYQTLEICTLAQYNSQIRMWRYNQNDPKRVLNSYSSINFASEKLLTSKDYEDIIVIIDAASDQLVKDPFEIPFYGKFCSMPLPLYKGQNVKETTSHIYYILNDIHRQSLYFIQLNKSTKNDRVTIANITRQRVNQPVLSLNIKSLHLQSNLKSAQLPTDSKYSEKNENLYAHFVLYALHSTQLQRIEITISQSFDAKRRLMGPALSNGTVGTLDNNRVNVRSNDNKPELKTGTGLGGLLGSLLGSNFNTTNTNSHSTIRPKAPSPPPPPKEVTKKSVMETKIINTFADNSMLDTQANHSINPSKLNPLHLQKVATTAKREPPNSGDIEDTPSNAPSQQTPTAAIGKRLVTPHRSNFLNTSTSFFPLSLDHLFAKKNAIFHQTKGDNKESRNSDIDETTHNEASYLGTVQSVETDDKNGKVSSSAPTKTTIKELKDEINSHAVIDMLTNPDSTNLLLDENILKMMPATNARNKIRNTVDTNTNNPRNLVDSLFSVNNNNTISNNDGNLDQMASLMTNNNNHINKDVDIICTNKKNENKNSDKVINNTDIDINSNNNDHQNQIRPVTPKKKIEPKYPETNKNVNHLRCNSVSERTSPSDNNRSHSTKLAHANSFRSSSFTKNNNNSHTNMDKSNFDNSNPKFTESNTPIIKTPYRVNSNSLNAKNLPKSQTSKECPPLINKTSNFSNEDARTQKHLNPVASSNNTNSNSNYQTHVNNPQPGHLKRHSSSTSVNNFGNVANKPGNITHTYKNNQSYPHPSAQNINKSGNNKVPNHPHNNNNNNQNHNNPNYYYNNNKFPNKNNLQSHSNNHISCNNDHTNLSTAHNVLIEKVLKQQNELSNKMDKLLSNIQSMNDKATQQQQQQSNAASQHHHINPQDIAKGFEVAMGKPHFWNGFAAKLEKTLQYVFNSHVIPEMCKSFNHMETKFIHTLTDTQNVQKEALGHGLSALATTLRTNAPTQLLPDPNIAQGLSLMAANIEGLLKKHEHSIQRSIEHMGLKPHPQSNTSVSPTSLTEPQFLNAFKGTLKTEMVPRVEALLTEVFRQFETTFQIGMKQFCNSLDQTKADFEKQVEHGLKTIKDNGSTRDEVSSGVTPHTIPTFGPGKGSPQGTNLSSPYGTEILLSYACSPLSAQGLPSVDSNEITKQKLVQIYTLLQTCQKLASSDPTAPFTASSKAQTSFDAACKDLKKLIDTQSMVPPDHIDNIKPGQFLPTSAEQFGQRLDASNLLSTLLSPALNEASSKLISQQSTPVIPEGTFDNTILMHGFAEILKSALYRVLYKIHEIVTKESGDIKETLTTQFNTDLKSAIKLLQTQFESQLKEHQASLLNILANTSLQNHFLPPMGKGEGDLGFRHLPPSIPTFDDLKSKVDNGQIELAFTEAIKFNLYHVNIGTDSNSLVAQICELFDPAELFEIKILTKSTVVGLLEKLGEQLLDTSNNIDNKNESQIDSGFLYLNILEEGLLALDDMLHEEQKASALGVDSGHVPVDTINSLEKLSRNLKTVLEMAKLPPGQLKKLKKINMILDQMLV